MSGNVTAYYEKKSNDGTSHEKIYITSGAEVKGDTEIHIAPKTGYVAAENAFITINGEPTDSNTSYKFNLTENTTISLDTVRESYKVEAAETATEGVAGGKVVITADGTEVESGNNVDGGSKVVFKAIADRGFVFDHWVIGGDTSKTADEYVIDEIGAATSGVKAVFKENSKNTLTGNVSPESRGKLVYTLYDIYGNVLEENKDYEKLLRCTRVNPSTSKSPRQQAAWLNSGSWKAQTKRNSFLPPRIIPAAGLPWMTVLWKFRQ